MACFMPFNNKNLEISFLTFRPTVVVVDDLLDALKQFSLCTQTSLGCVQTSLIQSIHGNLVSSNFILFKIIINCFTTCISIYTQVLILG